MLSLNKRNCYLKKCIIIRYIMKINNCSVSEPTVTTPGYSRLDNLYNQSPLSCTICPLRGCFVTLTIETDGRM
jgi:hypothetical protein